jgi:hypothetical protein
MYYNQFLKTINYHSKPVSVTATRIVEAVAKETYEEIPTAKVAEIIKEHHDVKVTDTLVESYIQLASSNIFSVDPVICELRKYNRLDRLIENKIQYVLSDQSVVTINEATQELLNKLLRGKTEVIDYMRESKENFILVVELIGE